MYVSAFTIGFCNTMIVSAVHDITLPAHMLLAELAQGVCSLSVKITGKYFIGFINVK